MFVARKLLKQYWSFMSGFWFKVQQENKYAPSEEI